MPRTSSAHGRTLPSEPSACTCQTHTRVHTTHREAPLNVLQQHLNLLQIRPRWVALKQHVQHRLSGIETHQDPQVLEFPLTHPGLLLQGQGTSLKCKHRPLGCDHSPAPRICHCMGATTSSRPPWPADNLGPKLVAGLPEWLGKDPWSVGRPAETHRLLGCHGRQWLPVQGGVLTSLVMLATLRTPS